MQLYKKGEYVIIAKPIFIRKKSGHVIAMQNKRCKVVKSRGWRTYCDIGYGERPQKILCNRQHMTV